MCQCFKIPPANRDLARAVRAERDPLGHAIALYSLLIDSVVNESSDRDFGGIADPSFEGVRLYTFNAVGAAFEYETATELGSEVVDEIEHYLLAAPLNYTLFPAILRKLRSVSPLFNSKERTVFLGSWGMGPREIGWLIRYLNDRPTFIRYLLRVGLTEADVDVYTEAFMKKSTKQMRKMIDLQFHVIRGPIL